MLITLIIFVAILSLLVFVHELGHFLVAKWNGVRVDEFGFGFPPRAWGWKKGDTTYSINWIPLGGFVKIKGEDGEHANDKDSFGHKTLWQRLSILVAGVVMNLVLAWVLMSIGFLVGLPQLIENVPNSGRVSQPIIHIASVLTGSPADRAGLRPGDAIVSVDGQPVSDVEAFRTIVDTQNAANTVVVTRGKSTLPFTVTAELLKETGRLGLGVALVKTGFVSYPWYRAPYEGLRATVDVVRGIFSTLAGFVIGLFSSQRSAVEFSGPVGIAILTSEVVKMGFRYLLQFTALLSVNLAVINILPIPALDGGRIFFLLIEAVRGKRTGRIVETLTHNIGFMVLMLLVLVVTYFDVLKYGDRLWRAVVGFFT